MSFLADTNVISELCKGAPDEVFLSVIVMGEIRRGIESIRRRDARAAISLDRWLRRVVSSHEGRILPVDARTADEWGRLNVPDPVPVVDGLMAATAKVHGLTLATRNVRDVERTGVSLLNPFDLR